MLNMSAGDVLVIFDIRRYEHDMTTLAEVAKANGVQIILSRINGHRRWRATRCTPSV